MIGPSGENTREPTERASAPQRLVAALVAGLDALFGPLDAVPPTSAWRRYLAVSGAVLAIIVARRPDIVTNPQFFAEDGLVYFPQQILLGPRAFLELYHGFPHFAHRLIAAIGGLVPAVHAPRLYCAAAAIITAFGLAAFVLPSFRHLIRRDALRVFFTLGVATIPLTPFDEQTVGTVCNLGWFIAVWLTLSAVQRRPATAPGTIALALTAAGAALSTPLATINVPLWGLRVLRGLVRRDRWDACYAGVPLIVICTAIAATPNLGAHTTVELFGRKVSMTPTIIVNGLITRATLFVAPLDTVRALRDGGAAGQPLLAGAAAVVLLLLGAWNRRSLAGLALGLYGFSTSIGITFLGRAGFIFFDPLTLPARYAVFPSAMLCLAVVAVLDALKRPWALGLSSTAVVAWWFWVRHDAFLVPPLADLMWRNEAARFERVLREPCPVRVHVPLNPLYAPMDVVWGPEFSERPTFGPVADLSKGDLFTQSFTSQCESLSEVAVSFVAMPPSRAGALRFELYRAEESVPIATVDLPRAAVERGWNVFCFPPVAGSKATRFIAAVRALGTDRNAPLLLHPTTTNPGTTDGPALLNGSPLRTRAALLHGCIERKVPSLPIIDTLQGQ